MATMLVPLLFWVVGLVLYLASPKLSQIGYALFAAGAFALAFAMSGHQVRLF